MLEFASFKAKEVELYGKEALNENLIFNEEEILINNIELFKKLSKMEQTEFIQYQEDKKPPASKDLAIPEKPLFVIE